MSSKSKAKKAAPVKATSKKAPLAKKVASAHHKKPKVEAKGKKGPEKHDKKAAEKSAAQKRRSQASAAMEEALKESAATESAEEEEFDPAAFFAASGGKGEFRAHVMRKERVDLHLTVRYRFPKGPLVYNAELMNLSKGGLCLRTEQTVKPKTVLRIEIPLPHTSELFAVQAEVVWSGEVTPGGGEGAKEVHTGLRFLQMSLAKQAVINQFIQQRRDEVIMAKIGLDKFTDSVPVAGLD